MGLFNFFKRSQGQRPEQAAPLSEDGMAQIRLRARRRLLGAVVLVLAAVVGLPLILETQPRPVAKDIDIDVRREGSAGAAADSPLAGARPLADAGGNPSAAAESGAPVVAVVPAMPRSPALVAPVPQAPATRPVQPAVNQPAVPARVATPAPVASSRAAAVAPVDPAPARTGAAAPASARTSAAAPTPARTAATPAAPTRTPTPVATPKPTLRPDDGARAKAALEAKPVVPAGNKFVVQVGAFEHAAAARETRGKVEKLGLKAYEQEVEAAGARRIRVRLGPYASREEAERMLQKLRASGMSASVMPL